MSVAVLEMIAAGSSYEQILAAYPDLTYLDIFRAAAEALSQQTREQNHGSYTVAEKRERYPRAYEKWSDSEDARLRNLAQSGATVSEIATRLQRNRGAIQSRILKLGVERNLTLKEQQRLRRITERTGG